MSWIRANQMLLALTMVGMAVPAGAAPRALHGDQFITMMKSNTISGTTSAGSEFNIYFLAGGTATYQDASGTREGGTWHLDEDGDVCVAWQNAAEKQDGCFHVTVDGRRIAWEGKPGSARATLRGGVSEMFLKAQ